MDIEMKQDIRLLVMLLMIMLAAYTAKAQCRDLDTQKLAELLVKEKKAGVQNDSVFTDFFRSCGLQYGKLSKGRGEMGFFKKYSLKGESYTMTVSFLPTNEDKGKNHRLLRIITGEHHTWWWMILKLQAFGMKMKEGQGDRHDMKGKGLFAGTGTNSIAIGY